MLTSQMGDLLAGLTEEGTGVMEDDAARKDGNTSPAPVTNLDGSNVTSSKENDRL
jgi:hypothetical protein